jgi:hypothetical protein
MKRFLAGVIITLAVVLVNRSCNKEANTKAVLHESSTLIQQQIANVSKLVVTEGHFSEVYNYKDSKELFGPLIMAQKRALVVVNANVAISYDLSRLQYEIDEKNRVLTITYIPEPEVRIDPDFEYYDVTADYFNPFNAADYNQIKNTIKASLAKKVEASSLRSNAENRLISELQKFYILTQSMGWAISYGGDTVTDPAQFRKAPIPF